MQVQGRQYPVDVCYLKAPSRNYVQESIDTVLKIHKTEPMVRSDNWRIHIQGDVLVFLPGQQEIETAVARLQELSVSCTSPFIAVPLYAALPQNMQEKALAPPPHGIRKV